MVSFTNLVFAAAIFPAARRPRYLGLPESGYGKSGLLQESKIGG